MCRPLALTLAATLLATTLHAQSVTVNVVANDQSGHPIHGLKPENFRLTENNTPQTILHIEEHSPQASTPTALPPPLTPGTYVDYTPIPANTTLNILLLDALNTPINPTFLRHQLQQYINQANPNTRIAIFGLANRLMLLQDFTSDPATLRNIVEHQLIPRSSSLLAPTLGPSATDLAANLRQFESEMGATETEFRAQFTLDALNTLGHYLAALPGRKNLIWLSGSFPADVLPDPTLADPLQIAHSDNAEFRETVNLLTTAQVSLYPLDARALTQPASDSKKFDQPPAAEHAIMDKLATATGGRVLTTPSNLAQAVAQAIDAGSNYYTLTYTPTNPTPDAAFRQIHIALSDPQTHLAYPHGYYSAQPAPPPATNATTDSQTATQTAPPADDLAKAYERAVMSRGAPTPQDLLFKARVLPASNDIETAAASDNQLAPGVSPHGPFRRYDIDYAALSTELTLTPQPDGKRSAKVEFLAYVFDADGRPLNFAGRTISFQGTPADFARLQHTALQCHLEISVPDRTETFLRIAVRDVPSNKFGVIELPASDVSQLPPPVYSTPPAPPTKPPTPPQD
jgi:VWFA-related protein